MLINPKTQPQQPQQPQPPSQPHHTTPHREVRRDVRGRREAVTIQVHLGDPVPESPRGRGAGGWPGGCRVERLAKI